jgi:maleamate amidohydrolase
MSGTLGRATCAAWEPFLTHQDRAFIERIGDLAPRPFGRSPALLMIDHCNYAIGREPLPLLESMERHPMSCGLAAWAAVQSTRTLLAACRSTDIPVVYSVPYGFEPNSPRRRSGGLSEVAPDEAWDREIIADLAPTDTEIVLPKLGASSFAGTPLDAVLRRRGIDTVIMTGNTTSGCVRATAIDAAYLQFTGFVVEECVYDRTEAAHAMNLFDIHYKYADVVSLARMLEWISGR